MEKACRLQLRGQPRFWIVSDPHRVPIFTSTGRTALEPSRGQRTRSCSPRQARQKRVWLKSISSPPKAPQDQATEPDRATTKAHWLQSIIRQPSRRSTAQLAAEKLQLGPVSSFQFSTCQNAQSHSAACNARRATGASRIGKCTSAAKTPSATEIHHITSYDLVASNTSPADHAPRNDPI